MDSMKTQSILAGLAAMVAAKMGPQDKIDLAQTIWIRRFKDAAVERRPSIVNEAAPNHDLMVELVKNYHDPIKAAREYLLRVYNQPRARDDTFELDPFGDESKMSAKDLATVRAMYILWDADFLSALKDVAPALGTKFISDFDWGHIRQLHKQSMAPEAAAAAYVAKMYPELIVK